MRYAKIEISNAYGADVLYFIVLSVEVFSILFVYCLVNSILMVLAADTAVLIGILVVGMIKVDFLGKQIV